MKKCCVCVCVCVCAGLNGLRSNDKAMVQAIKNWRWNFLHEISVNLYESFDKKSLKESSVKETLEFTTVIWLCFYLGCSYVDAENGIGVIQPYVIIIQLHTDVLLHNHVAQPAGAVEYTDCFSAEGYDPDPTTGVLDMTLNKSNGEVPVMLELCGMQSTPSLPSLPGSLSSEVV